MAGIRYGKKASSPKRAVLVGYVSVSLVWSSGSFGFLLPLGGSLALLALFLAAALLLTGLLTRRLIVLAGLVLVRHVVSFHGNIVTTARSRRRSDKTKRRSHRRHYVTFSLTCSGYPAVSERNCPASSRGIFLILAQFVQSFAIE